MSRRRAAAGSAIVALLLSCATAFTFHNVCATTESGAARRNTTRNAPGFDNATAATFLYDRTTGARQDEPVVFDVLDLWSSYPKVIVPTRSRNEKCRKQSEEFLAGLKRRQLWAMMMFDSSAKLPAGILNGNVNQYGDFDQCLDVTSSSDTDAAVAVHGKYCLSELDIRLAPDHPMIEIDQLFHSYYFLDSQLQDPGHRVPRFASIYWGICMPSGCSAADLEEEIAHQLSNVTAKVRVQEKVCYTRDPEEAISDNYKGFDWGQSLSNVFFSSILILTIIGSLRDYNNSEPSKTNALLKAFSLPRNFRRMMDTSGGSADTDPLACLHGIRALNALAILISHKSMALLFYPLSNRTTLTYGLGQAWSVIGRTSVLYTDSFMLMSGLLTSHSFLDQLQKTGRMNFSNRLTMRVFRILPNLAAIMLFSGFVLPYLGSGPQWNSVVKEHADLCRNGMWRSFLFIHNYYGFENMCLTHTHQLGIDMQLFILSPVIVWLLWHRPRVGMWAALSLGGASTLLRYKTALEEQLGFVVYHGMPVSRFFKTANYSYILPTHRATIYLMGVILGYYLHSGKFKLNLSKKQVKAAWYIAAAVALLTIAIPFPLGIRGYKYNPVPQAWFAAVSPLTWGCFLYWVILATRDGYAGWLSGFLRWKGFKVFSNIAYALYLTQFPIFFYNIGTMRQPQHYNIGSLFPVGELGFIFLASAAMAILIELPFLEIRKLLVQRNKDQRNGHIKTS